MTATLKLTPTIQMPAVGFGTYLIKPEEAAAAVKTALELGYRHIDTAEVYRNEVGVGEGLRAFLAESGLKRDDVFITTKLWPGNSAWGMTPRRYATTLEAMNTSLANLQLDYVDLYLIHAPFDPDERREQWRAIAELRRQGKARAIGVSNFTGAHIDELVAAGLPKPDANQIELHPWSQKPELVAYLEANDILPIAYSSLVPLASWRATPGQESAKTAQMRAAGAAEASPFRVMAERLGVSEAQVLLRWALQRGYAVLPKSTSAARMAQNLDLFSFALSDADTAAIAEMDRGDGVAWSVGDPTRAR